MVKYQVVTATSAAMLTTGLALAAAGCTTHSSAPKGRPAAAKTCKQQYAAWKNGPAKQVSLNMVNAMTAKDIPGTARYAKELRKYPAPSCADPHGYWNDLSTTLAGLSPSDLRADLAAEQHVAQLETDIQNELVAEKLIEPAAAAADPVSVDAKTIASRMHLTNVVVYNAATDPNNLLGRNNGYTSKVNFGQDQDSSIEVFSSSAGAQARKDYVTGFACPFGDGYDYVSGTALLRLDCSITPGTAAIMYFEFNTAQGSAAPSPAAAVSSAATTVKAPPSPSSTQQAVTRKWSCKVMGTDGSSSLQFVLGGGPGTAHISFHGTEPGQSFPGETVTATSDTQWFDVPYADIGASAEPVTCTAS